MLRVIKNISGCSDGSTLGKISETSQRLFFGRIRSADSSGAFVFFKKMSAARSYAYYYNVFHFFKSGIIYVRADVIDDVDGRVWDIGVEEQLRVKVLGLMKQTATSSLASIVPRTAAASPMNRT